MKTLKLIIKKLLMVLFVPVLLLGCENSKQKNAAVTVDDSDYVVVDGQQFTLKGKPYRYVGTNMWYAAYLGSENPEIGDRERLKQEFDFLKSQGITNLRLLGASEKSSMRDAMRPAISEKGKVIQEDILVGLDFALAEMAKRDLKAVIFLNNFWEWSGGMATYLSWVNGGELVDMADPTKPWPAFALFSAQFYSNPQAVELFNQYIQTLLNRRNTVNGRWYKTDPTIMAWQLANEPRPGDGEASRTNLPAYYSWIKATTSLIKSIAPHHLVSIGSEGTMGCLVLDECFLAAHKDTGVDYATFHMWLKNWGWFKVDDAEGTYDSARQKAQQYVEHHIQLSEKLNMPLVLEEFGMERDNGAFSTAASTHYRDQYFTAVFQWVESSVGTGRPLVGTNFWAWGGFGEAMHSDAVWRKGDKSFVGDPPQEPQGLNSVFASDDSTLAIIRKHAHQLQQ